MKFITFSNSNLSTRIYFLNQCVLKQYNVFISFLMNSHDFKTSSKSVLENFGEFIHHVLAILLSENDFTIGID